MKGRYFLEIKSRKVFYQLDIERKVTVIKGNSGTGKTFLIRMISDYVELGKDSGVHIQKSGEYDIKVFENRTDWAQELERVHDTIIFVDEDVRYLYEKNFQLLFQTADCYIVIVSRSGMFRQLPYAIASVYELRTQKDGKTFITRLYRIYEEKLLGDLTVQKYGFHYSKKKLNPFFRNETYKKQVEGQLTDVVHEIP